MADWVFLTRNLLSVYFKARIFEKSVVIFEISTLKFVQFKNFLKKKRLNLGEKIPYLSILHWNFEISTLKFVKLKNLVKRKLLKLLTKNALFGYFLDWIFKKLLSYFKSAHSNFSDFKILRQTNTKRIQSRTKYFIWVFLGLNFKKLFSYLKSARTNLSNCKILRENKNA